MRYKSAELASQSKFVGEDRGEKKILIVTTYIQDGNVTVVGIGKLLT